MFLHSRSSQIASGLFDYQATKTIRHDALQRNLVALISSDLKNGSPSLMTKKNQFDIKTLSAAKILVAEDIATIQKLARIMFEKMCAEISIAKNGEEAIEMHLSLRPDVILMDCQMPVMDGYEATKLIRAWEQKNNATRPLSWLLQLMFLRAAARKLLRLAWITSLENHSK
jgi:CheY-like chemotaxis protein